MDIENILAIIFGIYCIVVIILFKIKYNKFLTIGLSTLILGIIFIVLGKKEEENQEHSDNVNNIITVGSITSVLALLILLKYVYDRYHIKLNNQYQKLSDELGIKNDLTNLANNILNAKPGSEDLFDMSCLDLAKNTIGEAAYDQLLDMRMKRPRQEVVNLCGNIAKNYLGRK
jgi:hypothetical protein